MANQLNIKAIQTLQPPFRILTYVIAQVSYLCVGLHTTAWNHPICGSRILNKPCYKKLNFWNDSEDSQIASSNLIPTAFR